MALDTMMPARPAETGVWMVKNLWWILPPMPINAPCASICMNIGNCVQHGQHKNIRTLFSWSGNTLDYPPVEPEGYFGERYDPAMPGGGLADAQAVAYFLPVHALRP